MDSQKEPKYSDADVEYVINYMLGGTNYEFMKLSIIQAFKNLNANETSQEEDPYFHLSDGNYIGGLTMPKK
jgi:hypothetical protein